MNRDYSHPAMIELRIKWDGPVDGLGDQRLSLSAFGTPLSNLLIAVRRTASNMLREAMQRKETYIGRFAAQADQIDIQIAKIGGGSLDLENIITVQPFPGQAALWPEGLAEDALDRVLSDIERESKGVRRNGAVLDYLQSLPSALVSQDYWLYVDRQLKKHVRIGSLSLDTDLQFLPYLSEMTGYVIGVGFEPGRNFVRVKASDNSGSEITLSATPRDVDQALEMRSDAVRVLALVQEHTKRLLRIQRHDEPYVKLNEDLWIFKKWQTVLARLAQ